MTRLFLLSVVLALFSAGEAIAQISPVQMSILPNGRSGAPGSPVTYFATIVSSADEALTCAPQFGGGLGGLTGGVTGVAEFFAWDGVNITSAANAEVVIPAAGRQDYVVALTLDGAFSGPVWASIRCRNTQGTIFDVPRLEYVNDFQIRTRAGDQPDILVIADTLSRDGVARVGPSGPRAALMTVAAINIGQDAPVVWVRPEITGYSLLNAYLTTRICEIDAAGQCLGPQLTEIRLTDWSNGETRLFAVRTFVPPEMGVPFLPGILRLGVLFDDAESLTSENGEANQPGIVSPAAYHAPGVYIAEIALLITPIADVETPLPVTIAQCTSRLDADMPGITANEGGVLALTSDQTATDGSATYHGYFRINDANLEPYDQPVRLDYHSAGPAALHILGTGNGDQQETDTEVAVQVTELPGGLRISWPAVTGATNMFAGAGSAQCAWIPPAGSQLPVDDWLAVTEGDWTCSEANGASCGTAAIVAGTGTHTIALDPDGAGGEGGTAIDIGRPPDQNVANAIVAFFGMLPNQNGDNDRVRPSALDPGVPFGMALPSAYRPGGRVGVVADCLAIAVEGLPPTEADPQTADRDARVILLERPDGSISARERANCIP